MKKANVFSVLVSTGTATEFISDVCSLGGTSAYVCFANVHMIVEANRDHDLLRVVNESDIVAPDGKPISIFLNLAQRSKQERICGMDMLPVLLREVEIRNKSVFLYGSTDEVLQKMKNRIQKQYPNLRLAGYHSPPFRALTSPEKERDIDRINDAKADFVMVSLGCPKQEKWMAEHKHRIRSCTLGLGQAFQVFAGLEKRSPPWMQRISLEWLYRLSLEPQRLWKRYLYTNSVFIAMTIRFFIRKALAKVRQFFKRTGGESVA
jgi:N-acetylglucosaminyldiphosphoundecaprenol N-acetyl-beta-D-mannosaminyltransferase